MNLNFLNQLGSQAAVVGGLAVLTFVVSLLLSYSIVRDFTKTKVSDPSSQQQLNQRVDYSSQSKTK